MQNTNKDRDNVKVESGSYPTGILERKESKDGGEGENLGIGRTIGNKSEAEPHLSPILTNELYTKH